MAWTKEKHAEYGAAWYQRNKEAHKLRAKIRKKRVGRENKVFMMEIKKKLKCSKCGYDKHHAALDFHHVDESTKSFALGDFKDHAQKTLLEEIKKCIVLCACCHRIHHYELGWPR